MTHEEAIERLREAKDKWKLYENEYILPCFDLAKKSGIDLYKMVLDNPGKNCVILLIEALQNHQDLAQKCLSIMLERHWYPVPIRRGGNMVYWTVRTSDGHDMPLKFITSSGCRGEYIDPFSALVEADKWVREKQEAGES